MDKSGASGFFDSRVEGRSSQRIPPDDDKAPPAPRPHTTMTLKVRDGLVDARGNLRLA